MADTVNIEGLDALIKRLEVLPRELTGKRGGPVRSALRKAAVVVQKEAQANVTRLSAEGESNESTGTLRKALIVSRRKPGSFKGERYWVRIRRSAKSPDGVLANTYGGVLEFGDQRIPAKAWMRRAWETKRSESLATFTSEMEGQISKLEKKLAREIR